MIDLKKKKIIIIITKYGDGDKVSVLNKCVIVLLTSQDIS